VNGHQILKYVCGVHVESQCRCLGHLKEVVVGKRYCPTCMGKTWSTDTDGGKAETPAAPTTLEEKLRALLNSESQENGSDTPDFILAEYLSRALDAFNLAVVCREKWYGRR